MEHTFDEVARAALSLPVAERSRLVERLNESLSNAYANMGITDDWLKVAVDRLEEARAGKVKTIDGPTGLHDLRQRVRG